jgi:hypothetical protein
VRVAGGCCGCQYRPNHRKHQTDAGHGENDEAYFLPHDLASFGLAPFTVSRFIGDQLAALIDARTDPAHQIAGPAPILSEIHAAVVAAAERPYPAADQVAFVA